MLIGYGTQRVNRDWILVYITYVYIVYTVFLKVMGT